MRSNKYIGHVTSPADLGNPAVFAAPESLGWASGGVPRDASLSAESGTVTNGGTDLFTLYDPEDAGKTFDYAFTGSGTDQVNGSLTGSVTIGSDGIAYIDVAIENAGQSDPAQTLTLNVDGLAESVTVQDTASTSGTTTYTLPSSVVTMSLATANNLVAATLGSVNKYGTESGGSLLVGDQIDGGASNFTVLSLLQNGTGSFYGFDVLPVGIDISYVNEMDVDSDQALGGVLKSGSNTATLYFDTTGIDAQGGTLGLLNVQSSLGEDYIKAGSATDVTVHNDGPLSFEAAGVTILGGDNIDVTETGGPAALPSSAAISGASGTVSVYNYNAYSVSGGSITIAGGTDITVNGFGTVNVSGESGSVTVDDDGADPIRVTGGTADSITGTGAITVSDALGAVTVTDTGYGNAIAVSYGTDQTLTGAGAITSYWASGTVDIVDTGQSQAIAVEDNSATGGTVTGLGNIDFSAQSSAGTIAVNQDSATNGDPTAYQVLTSGGQNVVIDNVGGYINIYGAFIANANVIQEGYGPDIVTNPDGTQYDATAYSDAGASVTINDVLKPGDYGIGGVYAFTNGATTARITGGANVFLEDVNTVALVRTPGAAATPGTSALGTVTLDGVGGRAQLITDALTTLTIDHSGFNTLGATNVTVSDRTSSALALDLAYDNTGTTLTDSTATAVAVTTSGFTDSLDLVAGAATSLSIAGNQVLILASGAGLGSLTSITLTGAAGLFDGGVAHGLTSYASLKTINGSATAGNINVAINAGQSFTGGGGNDTVTISADQTTTVYGGSGSQNVLVANALGAKFTASGTGKSVSGFTTLRTTGASGGTYDLLNVFGGINSEDVSTAPSSAITFSNAGATQTLSIDGSLKTSAEITILQQTGLNAATALNLTLDRPIGTGVAAQTLTAQGYDSVAVNSLGGTNALTGLSLGTNTVTLADTAATSLRLAGAESLTMASTGSSLGSIDATAAGVSATLNLLGLGLTQGGVTLTDGAATVLFTGNVSSVKTDTVTFASANAGNNVITEKGTGALLVNGAGAFGNNIVSANFGVLDAVLGNGNNIVYGSNATTSIDAGNGNNRVAVGSGSGSLGVSVTLGHGSNDVTILSHGTDTVNVGGGKGISDSITLGNGQASISVGTETTTGSLAGSAAITVGNGNDVIDAGAGTYAVSLGTGNDTLSANLAVSGAGGVTVGFVPTASYGNDVINLGDGTNTINGALENGGNTVSLGNGANTVTLGNGNNSVTAGNGNDLITLGNGANTLSVGSGTSTLSVGGGANSISLGGGSDTINLAAPGSASLFSTITGLTPGNTLIFDETKGALAWEGGTAAGSEVQLPPNATFQDYLNAASFANGATNSQLAWFTLSNGNTYLVEDNSNAGTFVAGTDYVVQVGGSMNFADTAINSAHDGIVFHS